MSRREATYLHREGHKVKEGAFQRQTGESMQSYILRRKRWWTLLKQLDPTATISTEMRGDMLLDSARIHPRQRQMILTSTHNSTEFVDVGKASMEQLSDFHKHERSNHPPGGGQKKFFPRYGKGKRFQKSSFLAGIDDVEEEDSPDGENVVDEEPDEAEESFDDEVEGEALADQLNVFGRG